MEAMIANAVRLSFSENVQPESLAKTSFMYWAMQRPAFAQAHAARQLYVLNQLNVMRPGKGSITTVNEFFGGVGIGSAIVQKLFQPTRHCVFEVDAQCLEHLQRQSFSPGLSVQYGDAVDTMLECGYADLMFCDFPKFNPLDMSGWQAQLDHVFGLRPKAVYLNDTSFWSRHLHQERYAGPLNKAALRSDGEYIMAYSEKMHADYGYAVLAVAIHRGASFLYVPALTVAHPTVTRIKRPAAEEAMRIW
jgi:hypothetical protein